MKTNQIMTGLRFALMAAVLASAIGCSKISTENYDQIKMGMPYDEVIALIGDADECSGAMGIKNCLWGDEDRHINVSFAGDKVIMFSAKDL